MVNGRKRDMVVNEETKCVVGSCFTWKSFSHPFLLKKERYMILRDDVMWEGGIIMKMGVMRFVGWCWRRLLWRVKFEWTLWTLWRVKEKNKKAKKKLLTACWWENLWKWVYNMSYEEMSVGYCFMI